MSSSPCLIINRLLTLHLLVEHPLGAIVEFLESNPGDGYKIGHRFAINPCPDFFYHPKENLQYSLGDSHGGEPNVYCGQLLNDSEGNPVLCNLLKISCRGIKTCEFKPPTSYTEPFVGPITSPESILFDKTLAFYCAVMAAGCSFDCKTVLEDDYGGAGATDSDVSECSFNSDEDVPLATIPFQKSRKRQVVSLCKGKMILVRDKYNNPRLQCQYRSARDRAHLILRNIHEFNIPYLEALVSDDKVRINHFEQHAFRNGYGPLYPCAFKASASAQRQYCPYWHRMANGELRQGTLRTVSKCPVKFYIYTPYDLHACPSVIIVTLNFHNHARPFAVKTPPMVETIFHSLMVSMDWKLADTTPRKLSIDAGFISRLREHLKWELVVDPPLSQLHPSLGNFDHVRRLIDVLRKSRFPGGTGFDGVQMLVEQQKLLPESQQYVRCAETHQIEGGKILSLIVCMSKDMAHYLLTAKHLTIDTSFKRVHGKWQELELESWVEDGKRSVVGARAFTTSQSTEAHFISLRRIYSIAEEITGLPVRFHHIHGSGYLTWVADAHKGQALGIGLFCQYISGGLNKPCPIEPSKILCDLTPYDHLKRFYRLCIVHYKRNIKKLGKKEVATSALKAMYSLATTVPQDLDNLYSDIEAGGEKAIGNNFSFLYFNIAEVPEAWLRDKKNAKFVIPAIYQPASLISLNIWKASPSSTNGNEQAHRDANRDGINLTILGGVMHGMHRDSFAMENLKLYLKEKIYVRDQEKNHYRRAQSAITRQISVQRRAAHQSPIKDLPSFEGSIIPSTHSSSVQRHERQHIQSLPYPTSKPYTPFPK